MKWNNDNTLTFGHVFNAKLYSGPARGSTFMPSPDWYLYWNVEITYGPRELVWYFGFPAKTQVQARRDSIKLIAAWLRTLADEVEGATLLNGGTLRDGGDNADPPQE